MRHQIGSVILRTDRAEVNEKNSMRESHYMGELPYSEKRLGGTICGAMTELCWGYKNFEMPSAYQS